jgi:phosphoglycolate phosphatase-like HAD superfamily hydrolase
MCENKEMVTGPGPRIVLFDIDGTLIRAARRGEYRRLTCEMLVSLFGTFGRLNEVDFSGKTDLAIYSEALAEEGVTLGEIKERLEVLEAAKIEVIARMARDGAVFEVCRGVRELLDAMLNGSDLVASLLTGNLEKLAQVKLELVGLWDYFRLRGAFGSDDHERDHLPAIAAARIREQLNLDLPADRFVVVGDTPRDISCARHFGAKVLAVASGFNTAEKLAVHKPDTLLEDLTDTSRVLELLRTI